MMNLNNNSFAETSSGPPKPPPYVICYLCGRKYGTKSICIHEPSCIKKWQAENRKLPKHLRRKMPTKPDYSVLKSGDGSAVEQMNEMAFQAAQEQLIPCEFCGRTFYPERLPVHQRSCTADKPAAVRPRTVTKGRTAPLAHTNQGPTQGYKKSNTTSQSSYPTSRKVSNASAQDTSDPKIMCALCQKHVPASNIQSHLMRCNEEMTQQLNQPKKSDKPKASRNAEETVERPSTRTLQRAPLANRKENIEPKVTTNHATYDIDSPDGEEPQKPRKKSSSTKYSPPSTKYPTYDAEPSEENTNLVECHLCNRCFAADRIVKHKTICNKVKAKPRKIFDASKQRLEGTEAVQFQNKSTRKSQPAAPKSNWRQTHDDFIRSIRNAKKVTAHMAAGGKASDLPPPPPSLNPDYVHCQYCDRRFNPEVAARHIPKCATTMNRPKPPKQKALDAYNQPQRKKQVQSKNTQFHRTVPSRQNTRDATFGRSTPSSRGHSFSNKTGYVSPRYEGFNSPRDSNNNQHRPASTRGGKTAQRSTNFTNDPYRPKIFSGVDQSKPPTRGYSYNAMNKTSPGLFGGYH